MNTNNPFVLLSVFLLIQILTGLFLGLGSVKVFFEDSNVSVDVEVADTFESRRRGLMFRENLDIDKGMLFVYEDEEVRTFWMKNTYIKLDMIFIDSNGEIVEIKEAYPEPNTSEQNLKRYSSIEPAQYVLETNSSFVERFNIGKGEKVSIPSRYR